MTTSEIGAGTGMSQQNASRRLAEMESEGYIERGKEGVMISPKGVQELAGIYSSLRQAFEGERLEMRGKIAKGSGEGKYYLSLSGYRKQIKEKLGFDPFPGTLNVMVDEKSMPARQQLRRMEPFVISGFKDGERTYGDLFAYKCRLENLDCAIVDTAAHPPWCGCHRGHLRAGYQEDAWEERRGIRQGDRLIAIQGVVGRVRYSDGKREYAVTDGVNEYSVSLLSTSTMACASSSKANWPEI